MNGWRYRTRVSTSSNNFQQIDTSFDCTAPSKTGLTLATRSDHGTLRRADLRIEQPFVIQNAEGAVAIDYASKTVSTQVDLVWDRTAVTVSANRYGQTVSMCHQVTDRDELYPIVSSDGSWQLGYSRRIGGDGLIAAIYKPHNSLRLMYENRPTSLSLTVPVTGYCRVRSGLRIMMRRSFRSSP